MPPPVDIVLAFMDRINQRDPDAIADLMMEDHVFIDSLGNTVHGREQMRAGWRGYYQFCPDYSVSYEQILPNGNLVAIFGVAGGTIHGSAWRIPSAWLAVVENDRVKEWRVYADNKPVYDILARSKSAPTE
jgi:limonene-1,2-epoxide hydrolase